MCRLLLPESGTYIIICICACILASVIQISSVMWLRKKTTCCLYYIIYSVLRRNALCMTTTISFSSIVTTPVIFQYSFR